VLLNLLGLGSFLDSREEAVDSAVGSVGIPR
jgi:hypothetical protein